MRTVLRESILAVAFLVLAGATANLAASDTLEVKVPFPFVVNGHNLPAGQYRVERIDTLSSVLLIRGERGNQAAMFVLTSPAGGHDPAGTVPALAFRRYEDQYRLSSVWQSGTEGWSVIGK
jgi:hypothetical protein